jgi:DNA-binding CsgD family transcriptional regulator
MSDDARFERSAWLVRLMFGAIAVLIAFDLMVDYGEGAGWVHIAIELVVLLAAAGGIGLLTWRLGGVTTDLAEARAAAARWRAESRDLIAGLSIAIEAQFRRWELSKAEGEVALLLLKGMSHKEIARMRDTSERTVREQARAVYRKSALSGRAGLSAFFLEDLLLPRAASPTDRPESFN